MDQNEDQTDCQSHYVEEILHRQLPQLLVRGDNIVLITAVKGAQHHRAFAYPFK